jgi:hypothetical protein
MERANVIKVTIKFNTINKRQIGVLSFFDGISLIQKKTEINIKKVKDR